MPRSVSHVRPRRANAIVMLISSTKNDLTGGSALGSSAGGGRKQLFGARLYIHLTHERFRDTCHSGRFFAVFSCFIFRNRCRELNPFWVAKHPIDLNRVHCSRGMAGSQGRSVKVDGAPISEPIVLKFGLNLMIAGIIFFALRRSSREMIWRRAPPPMLLKKLVCGSAALKLLGVGG